MEINTQTDRPTNEFNQNLFTLEQVQECLNMTSPDGQTWLEFCQKQGWDMEDILRPLTYNFGR